ncbi:MAG: amidotransferase [Candidatus Melainabacteria bacterium GWF2_37_15]|nr:MAG: amidotransferase [Candidatus Melainabacteria bacterium GWF2_37_15]
MKIHYIQHVPFEDLGNIKNWAEAGEHTLTVTKVYENSDFPAPDSIDFLIILGGPMSIYQENDYPWLKAEKQFIKNVIKAGKLVLGICLGAQLLADSLGARVYKNLQKEIGWYPLKKTTKSQLFKDFPDEFMAFHWHGDTFELPLNSTLIASSEACTNQGFIYNDRVVALQFHLESSHASVEKLVQNCSNEIIPGTYIQNPQDMISYAKFPEIEANLYSLLDNMEKLLNAIGQNVIGGKL